MSSSSTTPIPAAALDALLKTRTVAKQKPFLARNLFYRFPVLTRDAFNPKSKYKSMKGLVVRKPQTEMLVRTITLKIFGFIAKNEGKGEKSTRRRTQTNHADAVLNLCSTRLGLDGDEDGNTAKFVSVSFAIYSLRDEHSLSGYKLMETHRTLVPVENSYQTAIASSPQIITLDIDVSKFRGEEVFLVIQVSKADNVTNWPTHVVKSCSVWGLVDEGCEHCISARDEMRASSSCGMTHLDSSGTIAMFHTLHGDHFEPILHNQMRLWSHDLKELKHETIYDFALKPHSALRASCPPLLSDSVWDASRWTLCFGLEHGIRRNHAKTSTCSHELLVDDNDDVIVSSSPKRARHTHTPDPYRRRRSAIWTLCETKANKESLYAKLFTLPVIVKWKFDEIHHVEKLLDWRCPICGMFCGDLDGIREHGSCSHDSFVWSIIISDDEHDNRKPHLVVEFITGNTSDDAILPMPSEDDDCHIIALNRTGKRPRSLRYVDPPRFVRSDTFEPLASCDDPNNNCTSPAPYWWLVKEERKMSEYLDLSKEEKTLMLRWNEYLMHHPTTVLDNGTLSTNGLAEFVKMVMNDTSRMNLVMLLVTFVDFKVITNEALGQVMDMVMSPYTVV